MFGATRSWLGLCAAPSPSEVAQGRKYERQRKMGKSIGKPWENGKIHGKTLGKSWENGKIIGKPWENGKHIGKPWENDGIASGKLTD